MGLQTRFCATCDQCPPQSVGSCKIRCLTSRAVVTRIVGPGRAGMQNIRTSRGSGELTSGASPRAILSGSSPKSSEEQYNERWHGMWDRGLTKGQAFDRGAPADTLVQMLQSGELVVQDKQCFVPGCGRGYDVIEFVKHGAKQAVGLELVRSAVLAARKEVELHGLEDTSTAEFVRGDFFTYANPEGPFDVGYDYTFFCALHPSMRGKWAAAWARHLRPGAELITLMFPVDPQRTTGPPWPVAPQQYKDVLEPQGVVLVRTKAMEQELEGDPIACYGTTEPPQLTTGFVLKLLEEVPPEMSAIDRAGKEVLGRWIYQPTADAAHQGG